MACEITDEVFVIPKGFSPEESALAGSGHDLHPISGTPISQILPAHESSPPECS